MAKAKPVWERRRGLIKVRVWRRKANDKARHSLSVVRLYRNGDQWKQSTRFGRDDLPLLRLLLDEAHAWMLTNEGASQ